MSDNPAPTTGPEGTPPAANVPETFSREYVTELRDEAAKYRNEKKDAVTTAQAETRAEVVGEYEPQLAAKDTEIGSLKETVATQGIELLKLKAVLGAEVPTADVLTVAELVQGSDDETISESVKRVMSIYGKTPAKGPYVDPSQGTGGDIPLNGNKLLSALSRAVGAE